MLVRWTTYGLSILLLLVAGCAPTGMGVRTAGETAGLRWRATDFRNYIGTLQQREIYQYTLVLENATDRAVTFTHIKADIWNNHQSPGAEWEKKDQWVLPAKGTVDIPLGSYRYCISPTCRDWGPLSPVWHLTLAGATEAGQPIQEQIKLRLPYVQHTDSIIASVPPTASQPQVKEAKPMINKANEGPSQQVKEAQKEAGSEPPKVSTQAAVNPPTEINKPAPESTSPKVVGAVIETNDSQMVKESLERWRLAWQSQNVEDYLKQYTGTFGHSNRKSRKEWINERQVRILKPKKISVEIDDLQLKELDHHLWQATFRQTYQSDIYQDVVTKTLVLKKSGSQYLIDKESAKSAK